MPENISVIIFFLNRKHIFQRTMSSSVFGRFQRLSESFDGANDANGNVEEDPIEPHVMPEEEIMHKYWKIAVTLLLRSYHAFLFLYLILFPNIISFLSRFLYSI